MHLHPVGLSADEVDPHYVRQPNATIRPLCHDAVGQPIHHRHWREACETVNRRFAGAAATLAADGTTLGVGGDERVRFAGKPLGQR
jgi:trehalose 6-phosphate synthase